MNTSRIKHSSIATAIAFGVMFSVSGCSPAAPAAMDATPTDSKEAGIFSKDVSICYTNSSNNELSISWDAVASSSKQGTLNPGEKVCGEGPEPIAKLAFVDGSSIFVVGMNPAIGYPEVHFNSTTQTTTTCDDSGECITFPRRITYESFSEGESKTVTVRSHNYALSRTANTSWVNFEVDIRG